MHQLSEMRGDFIVYELDLTTVSEVESTLDVLRALVEPGMLQDTALDAMEIHSLRVFSPLNVMGGASRA